MGVGGADVLAVGTEKNALTPRQLEVLRLAAKGLGNSEIGAVLGISPSTVKNHLDDAYSRLGLERRCRLSAVVEALKRGDLSLGEVSGEFDRPLLREIVRDLVGAARKLEALVERMEAERGR